MKNKFRMVVVIALGSLLLIGIASSHASKGTAEGEGVFEASSSPVTTPSDVHFVRQVPVVTKDVVFDRTTGKFYASVPSKGGAMGNSIARINPGTGTVEGFVFVGSEPGKLALSDDGHTLYVSLDGAGAVRRYDIATQTAGAQFSLGNTPNSGPLFVNDLAVAPGNPDLVAISRKNLVTQSYEGVAVYDNGVMRLLTTPRNTLAASTFIAFSSSASTLYGFTSRDGGLQKLSVGASGVSIAQHTPLNTPGGDFKFDNGYLYMPFGQVYDPETATLVGTFNFSPVIAGLGPPVEPDSSVGRVYFLTGEEEFSPNDTRTLTLRAFDRNTFLPVGTLEIPNVVGRPTRLVRWGANGLAFGSSGGQFYMIQTTLVPSAEPVPSPTATPSPTPTPTATPTPTPAPGQLREVAITAKDIVIDPATETIYASVPSSVGINGNSITPVDPVSGMTGQPVLVGSEPNKLAISDNGQFIYVGLDGAKAVRRFDVASRTPGLQFSLGGNQQGQFGALDLAVAPSQPQTVAVVRGSSPNNAEGGVALYDDGVQRPNTANASPPNNVIEYSASPFLLYGQNTATTELGFRKMAAPSCGISVLSSTWSFLGGSDFKIENRLAYSTFGRVGDPEAVTLVGTYPVISESDFTTPSAVLADFEANRVYFFVYPSGPFEPGTMFVRAFELNSFLPVGTLAVPNIFGRPTTVVRWGTDGFAFRTASNRVYLLQTSLIPAPTQPPPLPAPTPTPPTYTQAGSIGNSIAAPLPTVTLRLSGGQNGTTTTNPDGSFAFTGLPFCTDFTVTPDPLENYTFSPLSKTITPADQKNPDQSFAFFNAVPKLVAFQQSILNVNEAAGSVQISVSRSGDFTAPATVNYQTGNGTASDRSDYSPAIGTLHFAANQFFKQITLFVTNDVRAEGNETLTVSLSSPSGALLGNFATVTVTIVDNDATNGATNPADDPTFFVRQHYVDFLNRNPDAAGLNFWVNQITSCGSDTQCTEIRRINTSAAFFLSIEFQETGYLVYKSNQAAFNSGEHLEIRDFLSDTQELGRGVIIGQPGADAQLELNKQSFFLDFVKRSGFLAPGAYPTTLTAAQFVDKLNGNTLDPLSPGSGPALTQAQRDALVTQLSPDPASPTLRAQVLRSVSENAVFTARHSNKAFVLMQYFGYLRRKPNDAPEQGLNFDGYNFWLGKLNEFNGNFVNAEMVKAFLVSTEYRQRFGTP